MTDRSQSFFRILRAPQLPPPHSAPILTIGDELIPAYPSHHCGVTVARSEQQPIRIACEASYSGNSGCLASINGIQVSKAGDILQGALNAIVAGPGDGRVSSEDWDVECELKRFVESLEVLARKARDSATLARLRSEPLREETMKEGISGKMAKVARGGQNENSDGWNGNVYQPDERKGELSRKYRILSLWVGDYPGTVDGLLCAADKIMDEEVDELVKDRMAKLLQFEDVGLNHKTRREIFHEGMSYISDLMIGKWNEFLAGGSEGNETSQPTPEDIQHAVIEMAKRVIIRGYRTEGEVHKDKAQVYNIIRSHFARGYIRGQESLTTNAEVLNMEPWFLHGIEVAGQSVDMTMPSFWTRDSDGREHWDEVSLGRLRPWGDKANYRPSAPDASGNYPDDPIYLALTALEMQRDDIREEDYTIRSFPLPKTIRLPFLGWSPIPPAVYQSWSAKTLLQDTAANRRLMYERKDLDIARLRELAALKERWAEQDVQYLRRYRRYVVCDPEARERGYVSGRDISYLPAQRPPIVERVRGASVEPTSGVVTLDTESHDGANGRNGIGEPVYELESGPQFLVTNCLAQPSETDDFKCRLQRHATTNSSAQLATTNYFDDAMESQCTTGPIIAQIDEFLSGLVISADRKHNQLKQSLSAPQLDLSGAGGSLKHGAEPCVSDLLRPLSAPLGNTEKPLPSLPALARGWLPPSPFDDDEGEEIDGQGYQDNSDSDDLASSSPSRTLSPLNTIKGSPYILRNSLPHRRSSPEVIEAYARAVEEVHGLRRVNQFNCDSSLHSASNDDEPEGKSGVLVTKTVKGKLVKMEGGPRSEITHDAEGSEYSADVGGKGTEEYSSVADYFGVSAGEEKVEEMEQERWGSSEKSREGIRRTGSQAWGKVYA
ncbi:MAG: hypothetical protein M1813_009396 [Trichoglossum hirsutum]|nr:MAG: hypothetical protein M1813_009396 [Trichoglossum hirsutum]